MKTPRFYRRVLFIYVLVFLMTTTVYANAGTGFFFPAIVHILIGNIIIGLIEAFCVRTIFKIAVRYWIIILGNYVSSIVGYIVAFVGGTDDQISISTLPITLALLFIASVLIEWPFLVLAVKEKVLGYTKTSFKYAFYAQCVSYALLVPFHYIYYDTGRLPPITIVAMDLGNVASSASQYRRRPLSMGGGEGSYIGFSVPPDLSVTASGRYSVAASKDSVVAMAMDVESTRTIASVVVDSTGELHSWEISFQPDDRPFDEYLTVLRDIASLAYEYRTRSVSEGGEGGSYNGFTLPKEFSATKFRQYGASVSRDSIMLAMEIYNRGTSVSVLLDSTGKLHSWKYPRETENISIRSDLFVNDKLATLAHQAYQYRIRPLPQNGGGGSYDGFLIPETLSESRYHRYSAKISMNSIVFTTDYTDEPIATVSAVLDSTGKLHSWKWRGEFQ